MGRIPVLRLGEGFGFFLSDAQSEGIDRVVGLGKSGCNFVLFRLEVTDSLARGSVRGSGLDKGSLGISHGFLGSFEGCLGSCGGLRDRSDFLLQHHDAVGNPGRVATQLTQFLEGIGVPGLDHAVPVRGEDPLAILRDGSLDHHFTERREAFLQIEVGLPDLHFAVASGGDEFTGAGVVEGKRAAAMGGELLDLSAIVHLPENQLSIFRGGADDI